MKCLQQRVWLVLCDIDYVAVINLVIISYTSYTFDDFYKLCIMSFTHLYGKLIKAKVQCTL